MILSFEEVKKIAELARLHLTDEEQEKFRSQLSAILEFASQLKNIDTKGIPPTSSVLPARSALRKDEAESAADVKSLLSNAPETRNNQFCVPPVME